MIRALCAVLAGLGLLAPGAAQAGEPAPAAGAAKPVAVDRDRLAVHRIDIVDDKGVVRLSIAAPTPDPVVGGKTYRRAFPASGIVIFDAKGNERGGFGVADVPGGAPVLALDHDTDDAVGWKVLPDGTVTFQMNQRPATVAAARNTPTPVQLSVAPDGVPALTLTDKQNRPRLRLTVTEEGFGALEFLDANGKVVDTFAPEKGRKPAG